MKGMEGGIESRINPEMYRYVCIYIYTVYTELKSKHKDHLFHNIGLL